MRFKASVLANYSHTVFAILQLCSRSLISTMFDLDKMQRLRCMCGVMYEVGEGSHECGKFHWWGPNNRRRNRRFADEGHLFRQDIKNFRVS